MSQGIDGRSNLGSTTLLLNPASALHLLLLGSMPRSRCSPEEQVDNLNRRASEVKLTLLRKKVELAMRNRPRCIEPLWEKLRSMGISDEEIHSPETCPQSRQAQAVQLRKKRKMEQKSEEEAATNELLKTDEAAGVPLAPDPVPIKVSLLSDLTIGHLREKVICRLGPHFSVGNLRSMKGLDGSKEGLMRILEFATGLPPDLPLTGSLRCFNRLAIMIAEKAKLLGRRSALLTIPPDWDMQGLVHLKHLNPDGSLVICHRYTGQETTIPQHQVPDHHTISDLAIQSPWSEQRISIVSKLESPQLELHQLANYFGKIEDGLPAATPSKLLRSVSRSSLSPASTQKAPRGNNNDQVEFGKHIEQAGALQAPQSLGSSLLAAKEEHMAEQKTEASDAGCSSDGPAILGQGMAACAVGSTADIDESKMAPPVA